MKKVINENKKSLSYKDSGVDIDLGNKLVDFIKPIAKSTNKKGADTNLGGFGGLFDISGYNYKNPVLVSATDGVGTKLKIANKLNKHHLIGIDLVAMCVNDIIVQGAEPLFFLDYLSFSNLDLNIKKSIIEGIANGCKIANIALIGGETAQMPKIYQDGEYDLAGFSLGVVEKDQILPKKNIKSGDIMIGIKSSGLHSNGFSLVNYMIDQDLISLDSVLPDGKIISNILTEPTKIYVKSCIEVIKTGKIKALSHITGGGLTENIPRVLPNNLKFSINHDSFELMEIFKFLQKVGNIKNEEMYRTFNCGFGMVLICDKKHRLEIEDVLLKHNEEFQVIGYIENKY